MSTAEALANEHGVDEKTIRRDGKTINAADNHDATAIGLDIIKTSETGGGTSADYLTARLKRDQRGPRGVSDHEQQLLTDLVVPGLVMPARARPRPVCSGGIRASAPAEIALFCSKKRCLTDFIEHRC